jgi:hypothetical protein
LGTPSVGWGTRALALFDFFGLYWEYSQSSGQLTYVNNDTGKRTKIWIGYSGAGEGVNNPSMQNKKDIGPIPQGTWDIGPAYYRGKKRELRITLTPRPETDTFDRDRYLFRIHGDNPCGCQSASTGCIVLPLNIRIQIKNSTDRELRVVP